LELVGWFVGIAAMAQANPYQQTNQLAKGFALDIPAQRLPEA
jgi:hypothetical protein